MDSIRHTDSPKETAENVLVSMSEQRDDTFNRVSKATLKCGCEMVYFDDHTAAHDPCDDHIDISLMQLGRVWELAE